MVFGSDSTNPKSGYQYINIENGVEYLTLDCTAEDFTVENGDRFKLITIKSGIHNKNLSDNRKNQQFHTIFRPKDEEFINI